MSIFNVKENIKIESKEVNVTPTPIMESEAPDTAIVKQLRGYPWTVDYFNLITDLTDYQSDYDISIDLPITEYVRIKDAVIYLDSPLNNASPTELEGSGLIDLNIVPKLGDLFTAKLVDGRIGLFSLTSVKRGVYNLYNVFKIEFKIRAIIDESNKDILDRLLSKTVNTLVYNKDYAIDQSEPLYTETDYNNLSLLKEELENLLKYFNRRFIRPDLYNVLCFKSDADIIYDPILEKFVLEVMGRSKLSPKIYTYGLDVGESTFLDMMLDESVYPEYIKTKFKLEYPTRFGVNPFLKPLRYSNVTKVLLPADNPDGKLEIKDNIQNEYFPVLSTNDYYLFGEGFYDVLLNNTDKELTKLENMTLSVIYREPIEFNDIINAIRILPEIGEIQQLYFIPILYTIGRYYLSNLPRQRI